MYPNDLIPGVGFYEIFYAAALITALLLLRIMCDRLGFEAKTYNLALGSAVAAIVGGYASSVLVQSWYDYIKTGEFRLGSGMTFYGGLLGGILTFLIVYFAVGGAIFRGGADHIKRLPALSDIAACCVSAAHGVGRIGCLFAGCCHGARTDAWYGIYHVSLGYKVVPTQLFESLFLLALAAFLIARTLRGKHSAAIYLIAYGVWRFGIEYLRADDRGASPISSLTPSQLAAILFLIAGAALAMCNMLRAGRERAQAMSDRTRERVGIAIAAVGAGALIMLILFGIAGFDGAFALTVTRACGSVCFIGVAMYLGFRTRFFDSVPFREHAAVIAPALVVAINNAPLLPLLRGDAVITADAGAIAGVAVECFFIGLFEETAFRGVLLLCAVERFGRDKKSLFLTALVTSAIFGASHALNLLGGAGLGATLLQTAYSTLIGGMASLILLRTGSILPCVIVHAVYDFGGCCVRRLGEGRIWTTEEVILTAAVGCAAFFYYLLYVPRGLDEKRVRALWRG